MGRPSKLTPAQWLEVERRFLAGETARALGREFGVSEAAIRKKFGAHQSVSAQGSQVRNVAEKLAEAEIALQSLPIAQRHIAMDLAEKLRSISQSVASAAELGARTGHRLHALANSEVGKVDDADPLSEESITALKGVGVLTKLANESLAPALNLLAANKDRIKYGQMDDDDLSGADMTDGQLVAIAAASRG